MRFRVPYPLIVVVVVGAAASAASSLLTACSSDGATPKCNDTATVIDASDPDGAVLSGDCLYGPGDATTPVPEGGTGPAD